MEANNGLFFYCPSLRHDWLEDRKDFALPMTRNNCSMTDFKLNMNLHHAELNITPR